MSWLPGAALALPLPHGVLLVVLRLIPLLVRAIHLLPLVMVTGELKALKSFLVLLVLALPLRLALPLVQIVNTIIIQDIQLSKRF